MRNFILIVAVLLIGITGCEKKDGSGNGKDGVTIKGSINQSLGKSNGSMTKGTASLDNARKVLAFSKYNGATYYELYDIVDGSFEVIGQNGTGLALIFLDGQNKYIGHLSNQGLNMLPLTCLSHGDTTTINLSDLTLENGEVIPSHDPFGNEIQITANEINCLKSIDAYYKSIASNIDTDLDGIPDVLSGKELVAYTWAFVFGGHWGINNTVPAINDITRFYTNYKLQLEGGENLTFDNNNILLTGPENDPYNDIRLDWYMKAPETGGGRAFIATFVRETFAPSDAPWGSSFLPFKEGAYTLTLNGTQSCKFNYSNIDMGYNLVVVAPTLKTNNEGKLTSIRFQYGKFDGTELNPENIITTLMVQFFDKYANQFYKESNQMRLSAETGFSQLTFTTPVDISTLERLYVCYEDLLGNNYFIIWEE